MTKHLFINGEKYKVTLVECPDGSVDFCISDFSQRNYICKLTNSGELMLYADVSTVLKREESDCGYIEVTKELD